MDKQLRLRVILDAVDKLLKPLEGNARASSKLNKALKDQRERLKSLQATEKDIAARRDLEQAIIETTMKMQQQRRTVDQLRAAHTSAERPTKTLTRNYTNAREALARLERETDQHRNTLRQVETRLDQAGIATRDLARHEDRLRSEIAGANREIDEQKSKLSALADQQRRVDRIRTSAGKTQAMSGAAAGAGASALAAGAGAAAPLFLAGRAAMTFEQSMADVRKVVDFPTPAAFREMNRDILNLSGTLPVTSAELAALVAQGARAGVAREDLLAYAEAAAKMGVAFDVSSEDAGTMMATWRAALGLTHPEVIALADQVNYLTNAYGGNAAKVSEMITRVGPLADVAGASGSVLAALAQVMNVVGVEAEVGGTAIKNLLLGLTKGEAATRSQKEAFESLGLSASDMAKRMQTDAEGAITSVLQAVAKLPKERQLAVLGQLFGTESVAAIAPMLSQLDMVEKNLRDVGDANLYAGSMAKEFAGSTDTSNARLTIAGNKGNRLATILGDHLLPIVDAATSKFGKVADAVAGFADRHPGATKVVLGLVGGLAVLLVTFGALALAVAAVLAPFAFLQFAWAGALPLLAPLAGAIWGMVTATWAWTAALLANPLTWVVLAIVAAIAVLAGAAYLIFRNWGRISAFCIDLWNTVREVTVRAIAVLGSIFLNFTPAGLLVRAFAAVWPVLSGFGTRFLEFGGQLVMGIVNGVIGGIPKLIQAVMRAGGRIIGAFKEKLGIRSPSRVFAEFGGHTMGGLAIGIDRARKAPLDALGRVGAAMTGALALSSGSPALADGGGPGASAVSAGDTYTIHIHAAPGQDVNALADAVMLRIQRLQGARARSSFQDDAE